jgi:hypothetical protein
MSDEARMHLQGGAVRLTMPARVAFNIDGLHKTLAELANRLGHPGCASGCDVLYLEHEREFTVGEEVALNPQPIPPGYESPHPEPWNQRVNVFVPARVSSDLGALQKTIAATLGKLGCAACCSGFDIAFRREIDMITVNERAEVQGFGSFA